MGGGGGGVSQPGPGELAGQVLGEPAGAEPTPYSSKVLSKNSSRLRVGKEQ